MDLEDDQICTRLLESTQGVTKVNHLFRNIHPDHMEDATILLSDKLKSAMRACLVGNAPGFGELEFTLASLPNSKGGFGITDPHVLICLYRGFYFDQRRPIQIISSAFE
jgi:hypothetical protein